MVICHRLLLDGDWRTLAQWGQQRHRPLKVIVVSKAGDKTLQTAAGGGECLGVLFTPFDLDEAKSICGRGVRPSVKEPS